MTRAALLLVAGWMIVAASFDGAAPVKDEDLIKKMIPDAREIVKTDWKLTPERKARVEGAVGQPLSEADLAVAVYRVKADLPVSPFRKNADVLAAIFTVKGPKGEIRFGAGLHHYKDGKYFFRILTHLKVFDHQEDKKIESAEFLQQFVGGMFGPGLDAPVANVKKAIDDLKGADQEALKAAMMVYGGMQQTDALWTTLRGKGARQAKSGAEDAEQLIRVYDRDIKAVPKLNFMNDAERKVMIDQYEACKKELKAVAAAFKEGRLGDRAAFDAMLKSTRAACDGCHRVVENKFRGFRGKYRIMGQACLIDCDVYAPSGADAAACQALATGVKKAALVLFWSNPDALK